MARAKPDLFRVLKIEINTILNTRNKYCTSKHPSIFLFVI